MKTLWEATKLTTVVLFCIFMLVLVSGCTPLTEAQKVERRYERDARILEHHDQWLAFQANCKSKQGFVYIKWFGSVPMHCRYNNDCAPRPYDTYYCVKSMYVVD